MSGILLASVGVNAEPIIGQPFGGGYYAGKISMTGNGVATHYLIVAPRATGQAFKAWKTTQTSSPGPTSPIDGLANSNLINNALHPAAQFCRGLTIGGYTDWYLPAQYELELLYYYFKPTTNANTTSPAYGANPYAVPPRTANYTSSNPPQTTVAAFQSGGSEALSVNNWASIEAGVTTALTQYFTNGEAQAPLKTSTATNTRAVRRIPI